MDATAISLCMDNKLPIVVFNLKTPGNIRRVVMGEAGRHDRDGVKVKNADAELQVSSRLECD